MLLADGCYYSDRGMDKITDLFDVAGLLCAHFDNEYLVVGFQIFADGADDP